MQKFRPLLIALVSLMLTVSSVCWASANSHACCGNSGGYTQELPDASHKACCITPTVIEAKVAQQSSGPDIVTPAKQPFEDSSFYQYLEPAQQSLLNQEYMADQSGRHLELSVLLN